MTPKEQYGQLNLVLFTPDDLLLVKGDPSLRRKFLDMEIAQISPVYYDLLSKYNRVLQQRNKFLKQCREAEKLDEAQLSVWDVALSQLAAGIWIFVCRLWGGLFRLPNGFMTELQGQPVRCPFPMCRNGAREKQC